MLLGRRSAQQAGAASAPRVLAVYSFGSAVFFNSDPDVGGYLGGYLFFPPWTGALGFDAARHGSCCLGAAFTSPWRVASISAHGPARKRRAAALKTSANKAHPVAPLPQADAFWLEKLQGYVRDPHKQPLTDGGAPFLGGEGALGRAAGRALLSDCAMGGGGAGV